MKKKKNDQEIYDLLSSQEIKDTKKTKPLPPPTRSAGVKDENAMMKKAKNNDGEK